MKLTSFIRLKHLSPFFSLSFPFFARVPLKKSAFIAYYSKTLKGASQQCVAVPVVVSLSEQVLQNSKSLIGGR